MSANKPPGADAASIQEHFENVADFAVRLISHLQENPAPHGGLMQEGTSLKVNYPALHPFEISRIEVGVQGQVLSFRLAYQEVAPGKYAPVTLPLQDPPADVHRSDAIAIQQSGYISIVPIDSDYTAHPNLIGTTRGRLVGLLP